MKWLEYSGVFLAAIGFTCLSAGFMLWGWTLGIISCCLLIPYFYYNSQLGLFSLQSYFFAANIYGLLRLTGGI